MMIIKTITKTSLILLCLGVCVFSCTSESDGELAENAILLTAAEVSNTASFVLGEELPSSVTVTAKSTLLLNQDVSVNIESAPNLVKNYNEKNKTDYFALPKNIYTFSKNSVVIKSGSNVSEPIKINLVSIEGIDTARNYMLPVTIKEVNSSNDIAILEASKTIYYILKNRIISPALRNNKNVISPLMTNNPKLATMSEVTLEGRVYIHNSRTFLATLFGTEESFILRIEDGKVALRGNEGNGRTEFSVAENTWYHIAATFDGTKARAYVNGEEILVKPNGGKIDMLATHWYGFHIGAYNSSGSRSIDATFSEVRLWSVVRSANQIKNNACIVDPKSEGLEAYWKFNEGKGNKIIDVTGNGHDATINETKVTWEPAVKCE